MKLPTKAAIIAILGDFTFIFTILAALPYELGDVAQFVTPDLKATFVKLGIFSTIGLKVVQRIMERLQGNKDASNIELAATTTKGLPPSAVAILLLCGLMVGCATNTPDAAKNARNAGLNAAGSQALTEATKILGRVAVQTLFSVAQSEMSGGKVDFAQSAANGLWSQANSGTTSEAIGNITTAFSAGKAKQTAATASSIASPALAAGANPVKVASAIATVISTAAGAPPAVN